VEQALDELVNRHDLDHLVSTRLHPNRVAVGFRLRARTLAIGFQIHEAAARPRVIREPRAFQATHVDGLAVFRQERHTVYLTSVQPSRPQHWRLPWSRRVVRLVA
jgi:hypothetical protein